MTDILSQEEIDRLLRDAEGEEPEEVGEPAPAAVGAVADRLSRYVFAAAQQHLSRVLPKEVAVSGCPARAAGAEGPAGGRHALIRVPLRPEPGWELVFLIDYPDAKTLADLLLGGAGAAEGDLDASEARALTTALAAVAADAAEKASRECGWELSAGAPVLEDAARPALAGALARPDAVLRLGRVRVGDALDAPLGLLLPPEAAFRPGPRGPWAGNHPETAGDAEAPLRQPGTARDRTKEGAAGMRNLDLILDLEVDVMVRLGESVLPLREVRQLKPGSVLTLDRDSEAPVDLLVNGRVVARGELVVVGSDSLAVRITEIETPSERIRTLGA